MTLLELSWQRAWHHLGLPATADLQHRLIAAYGEPHRRYHSLQHLQECLAHFDETVDLANHPGEVEIALWFHDAIYELKSKNNEQRSADWAIRELAACGAPKAVVQRVDALIMATCHDALPSDPDQQLLVDIDLSILGASSARFAQYNSQVKDEYSWVPSFLYRIKRREVLKGFLARQTIYSTDYFRARYEQQAKVNLEGVVN